MSDTVSTVLGWTASEQPRVAVGINANSAFLARGDARLAAQLRAADLAYPDGQSVVWADRLLGGGCTERVATTDLVHPLTAALTARGPARYFLLGGTPEVVRAAARRLETEYPGLSTRVRDGYEGAADPRAVVEDVNDFAPDVLWVGMGDPRQQQWVQQHRDELRVGAVLTCGGLFDWLGGVHRRPPDWMVRAGLEWLWRLALEPRRLLRRYLLGNPWFVARLARDKAAQLLGRRP
ncbi:WecB/TagA/CpsF family glycosyltransferase [Auraticoccus cholistanensis]|nr:WecB/TagA/CpsF family glycosyltransferase [Auraticoccus cholistanensis]